MNQEMIYSNLNPSALKGNWIISLKKDNCMPCKMLSKTLQQFEDNQNILNVNLEDEDFQDASITYGARSAPTLLLVNNGRILHSQPGFQSPTQLKALINTHFKEEEIA